MTEEITIMLVTFLGVFIGVFLRTWLPARRKIAKAKKLNQEFKWRRAYIKTAGVSFVVAFIGSFLLLPAFNGGQTNVLTCFAGSFTVGFGSNAVVNEIYALVFAGDEENGQIAG